MAGEVSKYTLESAYKSVERDALERTQPQEQRDDLARWPTWRRQVGTDRRSGAASSSNPAARS